MTTRVFDISVKFITVLQIKYKAETCNGMRLVRSSK